MSNEKFIRTCPNCNEVIEYKRLKDRNFYEKKGTICRKCSIKFRASKGNYNPKEEFECFTCKTKFMTWRSQVSDYNQTYCSMNCKKNSEIKSFVGQKIGRLLIEERFRKNKTTFYKCKCDCGKDTITTHSNLGSGSAKSCGCLLLDTRGSERKPLKDVIQKAILNYYKRNAKSRNYEWKLDKNKFEELINGNCYYCNSGLSNKYIWKYKYEIATLPFNGIDRVDNTIGYTEDNCVSCCKTCNMAKSELTVEEFKTWIIKLNNHFIKKK